METRKELKKRIRELFFISVKNDIDKWNGYRDFYSPNYGDNYYLIIDNDRKALILSSNDVRKEISKYRYGILILDFKVWYYALKLKRHFKQVEYYRINSDEIEFFQTGISSIEKSYVKEIRKEKIEKIQNNA